MGAPPHLQRVTAIGPDRCRSAPAPGWDDGVLAACTRPITRSLQHLAGTRATCGAFTVETSSAALHAPPSPSVAHRQMRTTTPYRSALQRRETPVPEVRVGGDPRTDSSHRAPPPVPKDCSDRRAPSPGSRPTASCRPRATSHGLTTPRSRSRYVAVGTVKVARPDGASVGIEVLNIEGYLDEQP